MKKSINKDFGLLQSFMTKVKSKYFQGKENAELIVKFGWLFLATGILSLFSLSGAFAIYALILYLISIVTCCICPCIGAGGIAGTTAIWTLLVVIDIYIAIGFLILIGITGFIGIIYSLLFRTNNRKGVIISGAIQIAIAIAGLRFLYPFFSLL